MAVLPRESIQITAGRKGVPSTSTATVPDHWAVHPTPTTLDAGTDALPSVSRAAATMALHHAAGSCSAPPPGNRCSSTGTDALAAILPPEDASPDAPLSGVAGGIGAA